MIAKEKREPRPFQRKVLKILREGKKSVILQAPTGSGKTDAALQPYVQCLAEGGDWLPRTCLYATPLRVLSYQFHQKFHARMATLNKAKGARLTEIYEKLKRDSVSIQTGEQPDDPQFESLLTFCTIDQLVASFLAVPYSIERKRANLNVGAVIGSFLVLDEFHLYPLLEREGSVLGARTTVLTMLRLLSKVTRFVLMTATFSTTLINELAALLDAEVVTVDSDEELALIADGRQRTFEVAAQPMTTDTILADHQHCSLVICNTVLRAQQRYWELRDAAHARGIEVVLLHSRLTAEDRAERSQRVMHTLGPAPREWKDEERYGWKDGQYYGKKLIVVATQVVEVGLDISVETLHTEIAPANSLIQRAGRCARFAQQRGRVIVYELPEDAKTTLPYHREHCEHTLEALRKLDPQQSVGFKEEQALIDDVHTEEDRAMLARYKKQDRIEKEMFESFCTNQRGIVSTLIRDVTQVQILIHDNPNDTIVEEPWRWQRFALHPGSLAGSWQALEERRAAQPELEWVCRQAILQPQGQDEEADSRQKARYRWDVVASSGKADALEKTLAQALIIVLPTELATYHDELGFVLLDGRLLSESTGYQSTPPSEDQEKARKKRAFAPMKRESYQEHINGLIQAYSYDHGGIRANMRYVFGRLEMLMNLPEGSIDQAMRLAIACHDLGKLTEAWQQWAWEWQTLLHQQQDPPRTALPARPFFFAKTENDSSQKQRDLQRSVKHKRPHHACESVMIGVDLIADSLGLEDPESVLKPLLRATCAAIARHHTPQAHEYNNAVLASGADEPIKAALELVRQGQPWQYDLTLLATHPIKHGNVREDPDASVTEPERGRLHELETWLYFLMVRALRLADQRAGIRW